MKKLSNLLAALVFVSLVIFISCGKDDSPAQVDPLVTQAALLEGSWTANAAQVVYNSGNPDVSWDGFSLTISNASASGGSYSTDGVPADFGSVWGDGSWTFNNGDIDEILRTPDNIVMNISSVSDNSLTLTFDIPEDGGRAAGIAGTWSFTFTGN